jgi:hypothetical protein
MNYVNEEGRVFAHINYVAVVSIVVWPYIFFGVLWFILSDLPISVIMTWRNWLIPTIYNPLPLLTLALAVVYNLAALYILAQSILLKGKYIWEDGYGILRVMYFERIPVSRIDADSLVVSAVREPKTISYKDVDGTSYRLKILISREQPDVIVEQIRRRIHNIKATMQ